MSISPDNISGDIARRKPGDRDIGGVVVQCPEKRIRRPTESSYKPANGQGNQPRGSAPRQESAYLPNEIIEWDNAAGEAAPEGLRRSSMAYPNRLAMTREETCQMLTARAEAASTLIAGCIAFIDTVTVLLPRPLQWPRLRRHNAGHIIAYTSQVPFAPYAYRIQQPSLLTIEYVAGTERHLVSRFDLALDFMVTSTDTQLLLRDFLGQHLTQRWRGGRERTTYEGTLYFGPASTRRNVTIYSSLSKITRQPAVHLELRYICADACRRRGVDRIGDLLALDIDACIHRDIRFSAISWRTADRAIDKLAEKLVRQHADRAETVKTPKTIYDRRIGIELARARVVELFRRSMADENREVYWCDRGEFAAQDCIDGWRVLRDAAVHVPPSALIKRQPVLIWP